MSPILKQIIAVVSGLVAGSIVNMGIITVSGSIIPPPEGADVTTMEGLKSAMHLFEPKHFLLPFLAHALGTFAGAYVAAKLAGSRKLAVALTIGVFFLIGGITNIIMLRSPIWFTLTDLLLAYIPFSYLAGKIVQRGNKRSFSSL